jgi:hypothetical protein
MSDDYFLDFCAQVSLTRETISRHNLCQYLTDRKSNLEGGTCNEKALDPGLRATGGDRPGTGYGKSLGMPAPELGAPVEHGPL